MLPSLLPIQVHVSAKSFHPVACVSVEHAAVSSLAPGEHARGGSYCHLCVAETVLAYTRLCLELFVVQSSGDICAAVSAHVHTLGESEPCFFQCTRHE